MPILGISNGNCEGDGRYNGHKDLLFKRSSFQTIRPFENVRNIEVHTLLSRTLRDIQSCVVDKSICLNRSLDTVVDSPSPCTGKGAGFQRTQCLYKWGTLKPEEIAEYYIEKASTETEKVSSEKVIDLMSKHMPRVSDFTNKALGSTHEKVIDNVRTTTATKLNDLLSDNFFEDTFIVNMKLAQEFEQAKKRVESSKDQKSLRALTKRTVIEKVTVESKKTASDHELLAVSGFLSRLLTGQLVTGYGGKVFQLSDSDIMRYGMIVTIESYMGIVERDPSLALVISRILIMISCAVPNFESVLVGKILATSHILEMDEKKCLSFAENLLVREDRGPALLSETSIVKLFFHLYYIGSKNGNTTHFTSKSFWMLVSLLLNRNPIILATATMLSEIITSGTSHMKQSCPEKWMDLSNKIANSLLPSLEMEVDKSVLRRSIGEDTIVSRLRHSLLRCLDN